MYLRMDVVVLVAQNVLTKIEDMLKKGTIYYAKGSGGIKEQASNRETIWILFYCQKRACS